MTDRIPATPALAFRDVAKHYGGAPALAGATLEVGRGEFFALVGVNGAGKTTLIKCLLDFCRCDAGAIDILGVPHRRPGARSPLAFLPERLVPPHYLTGRDFIEYVLQLNGARYAEPEVLPMLAAFELEPTVLDAPVRTSSKGMTQKLGLAACLLARKALYVLDEPASGLDPKARALFKDRLAALRPAGATVFFTSHALADVEEICDRLAVLHAGRVVFAGTPGALRAATGAASLEAAFLRCIGGTRTAA